MKIVKTLFKNLPTSLLTLFFILFSLGQLQRIQVTHNIAFYLHDIVIVIFVFWYFLNKRKNKNKKGKIKNFYKKIIKEYRLELFFIIWLILGMTIGAIAGRVAFKALLYAARLVTYGFFAWSLAQAPQLKYSPQKGFVAAGTLIAIWGSLQYVLLPDTRFLHIFGWDNHYFRLISTLLDPAFTGIILVLTFGLWHGFEKIPPKNQALISVIKILLVIAVSATFSRASFVALLLLIGLLVILKKTPRSFAFFSVIIFLSSLLLLPKPGGEGVNLSRTSTANARTQNAQQGLAAIEGSQWLWGRGLFNNDANQQYLTPNHAQLPDSFPILIINATGIGGLIISIFLAHKWLKHWWQTNPLWTSLLVVTATHSLFNNTLLQPFVFLIIWGSKDTSNN